ncbi:hypothetical protein PCK2_000624 [Pneumocystis canis]|nr:hypothetical protein PCK2_000624 [Pneumocystis canis]
MIVPSRHSHIESFKSITPKGRFKFKFPKIRISQKYNQNNFSKIIIPIRHSNKGSSEIKFVSHVPEYIKSNSTLNSNSSKKQNIISIFKKKKVRRFFIHSSIKQDKIDIKNYNFFKKFILKKSSKKTCFKNNGTQTYISMFTNSFSKKPQMSELLYSQNIFDQKENINLFKDTNTFHKFNATHLNLEDHANIEKSSSAISGCVINESYKHPNMLQSDKSITLETNTSEHSKSPKQSTCCYACTCLCEACHQFPESRRSLNKRPPSIKLQLQGELRNILIQ